MTSKCVRFAIFCVATAIVIKASTEFSMTRGSKDLNMNQTTISPTEDPSILATYYLIYKIGKSN